MDPPNNVIWVDQTVGIRLIVRAERDGWVSEGIEAGGTIPLVALVPMDPNHIETDAPAIEKQGVVRIVRYLHVEDVKDTSVQVWVPVRVRADDHDTRVLLRVERVFSHLHIVGDVLEGQLRVLVECVLENCDVSSVGICILIIASDILIRGSCPSHSVVLEHFCKVLQSH